MRRFLIRLYPERWRERYGAEYAALLDERPLGPWDVADVLLGAVDAHVRGRAPGTASALGRGGRMSTRTSGYAAMAGGLLWSAGLFGVTFDPSGRPWAISTMFAMAPWPWPPVAAMLVGMAFILLAVIGLSAVQARSHPRLIWASVVASAFGILVPLIGLVGVQIFGNRSSISDAVALDSAWDIWTLGLFTILGGSAAFALATWRARVFSRVAAVIILSASTLMIATFVGGTTFRAIGPIKASWWLGLFFLELVVFSAGWIALGWSATRAGRSSIEAPVVSAKT
jgi:hypothetical protein